VGKRLPSLTFALQLPLAFVHLRQTWGVENSHDLVAILRLDGLFLPFESRRTQVALVHHAAVHFQGIVAAENVN